jgi:hypothetical protein
MVRYVVSGVSVDYGRMYGEPGGMAKARGKRRKRGKHQQPGRRPAAPERSTRPLPQSDSAPELRLGEQSTTSHAQPQTAVTNLAPQPPLIIKAQWLLWTTVFSCLVSAFIGWILSRALVQAHGVNGAWRIAVASVLPVVIMIFVGGMVTKGFTRAGGLQKYLRLKIMGWAVLGLILVPPLLWQWSGYPDVARHVTYGAFVGFVTAFVVQLYISIKHPAWVLRKGGDEWWRWEYRAMAFLLVLLGGFISLQFT